MEDIRWVGEGLEPLPQHDPAFGAELRRRQQRQHVDDAADEPEPKPRRSASELSHDARNPSASSQLLTTETEVDTRGTKEVLQQALRYANHANDVGQSTILQLQRQGEQIDGIHSTLDEVEYELKVSDRIVRGMSSWSGMVKNWFTSKPAQPTERSFTSCVASASSSAASGGDAPHERPPRGEPLPPDSATSMGGEGWSMPWPLGPRRSTEAGDSSFRRGKAVAAPAATPPLALYSKEEDELLDALMGDVASLKAKASIQGDLLDTQNRRLDELHAKADHAQAHMVKTNRNIRKML